MSKPKFTPGPWITRAGENGNINIGMKNGRWVATVYAPIWHSVPRQIDVEADATLIAAAPDLYAALAKAVDDYGKPGGPWNVPSEPGTWIQMAKDALNKARGE